MPQLIKFEESPYRWVILLIVGLTLILNGVANNALTPLQHKITVIYGFSQTQVSICVIITLLIYSLVNFPVNHVIDSSGLKVTFIVGSSLYLIGTLLYIFIDYSYIFIILGTVFFGLGQPFLMNSPSKVAAIWFFPQNRALATALMTGINLLGIGVGFILPTLIVQQQMTGDSAKDRIFWLYLCYFIFSVLNIVLILLFMKAKPVVPPSQAAEAKRMSSPLQSLKIIKQDPNLCKFFIGFQLINGSFIAFASNCNFIIKPYGYSDVEIAINAVVLMGAGVVGSILFSLYIKKTFNYKITVRIVAVGSILLMSLLTLWLNSYNGKTITTIIIILMGLIIAPMVPICYDLGSELAFPIGQAQVTGFLNGVSMLWAFSISGILSYIFGYDTKESSLHTMEVFLFFVLTGSVLLVQVEINLKKRQYEKEVKKGVITEQVQFQQPSSAKQIKECTDLQIPQALQPSGLSQSEEYFNYNRYRFQNLQANIQNI